MTEYFAPGVAPDDLTEEAADRIHRNVRRLVTEVKANLVANEVRRQESAQ